MKATPGDRLVIKSHKIGEHEKVAEILEVHGDHGGPPYLVRSSDDGHEGLIFPGRNGRPQGAAGPDPIWVLEHTKSVTLPDGTEVVLRPILPQDKAHLVSLLRRMSAESRHLRFHHSKAWLTRRELRYLTEIDYGDHFAWCAFIVDDSGTSAIGVARFIRVAPESDRAEVTIEIVDRYQGRGLGATLIDILAQTALGLGITSFIAYVDPTNRSVIRWAEKAGASSAWEHGVLRLELSLIATRSPYPRASQELVMSA